jgi:hypothetical protein
LAASGIGGFEGFLTEVAFEFLSGMFNTAFDLIEFVQVGIDGKQEVKSTNGGIALVGGGDVALKRERGSRDGHRRFLGWE